MKGLILKDLLNLKKQGVLYMLLIIMYGGIAVIQKDISFFGGMICIFAAMLPIQAMAFDEKANWDKYALTMPISRRDIIVGKYILGIVGSTIGGILTITFSIFIKFDTEIFFIAASLTGVGILMISIVLPILFKLGVEKGRMLMLAVIMIPTIGVIMVSQWFPNINLQSFDFIINNAAIIGVVALIIIFIMSLSLSISIFNKKEL